MNLWVVAAGGCGSAGEWASVLGVFSSEELAMKATTAESTGGSDWVIFEVELDVKAQ